MRTIEIATPAHPASLYLGALLSSGKRPGAIKSLPKVNFVRPSVTLDAEHIKRYSDVCGFTAAHGVPISYPQMLTFPLVMEFFRSASCPWPAMGTVHLANRIAQHQSLQFGDDLRVAVATGQLMSHEKGQIFTLNLSISRDDELVWEATQTLLRLGVKNPVGPKFESELNTSLPLSRQADFLAAADLGRRYGKVSGDLNPIHLSALSAKLFGFRRAIAHGLWTKARALASLMPPRPVEQATVQVEFKTPLYLPARSSLWTARTKSDTQFEVRTAKGDKPHLRGQLTISA